MKRYRMNYGYKGDYYICGIGEWVKYSEVEQLERQNKELLYALNDIAIMVNPSKKNEEGMTKWTKAMDLIEKIEKENSNDK